MAGKADGRYIRLMNAMQGGKTIVLDGGTGTEIQRMGASMDRRFWCAEANRFQPDVVTRVHKAYLAAGADIITANSYATSPLLFDAYGESETAFEIDAIAVSIARDAIADSGTEACLAGSVSIMRPDVDTARAEGLKREWTGAEVRLLYARKSQGLADAGCDLILMEMMRDDFYSVLASKAAQDTGLPVWIGLSAWRDGPTAPLCGWERPDMPFEHVCETLAALKPAAMGIMHTHLNDVAEALSALRRHWAGPIYVYPELGHFEMPNWVYSEDLSPSQFAGHATAWAQEGVGAIGGCCGIGPHHIEALHDAIGSAKPAGRSAATG